MLAVTLIGSNTVLRVEGCVVTHQRTKEKQQRVPPAIKPLALSLPCLCPALHDLSSQIPGEGGPRRLQKICAGGIFGEVGFFLRSPQMFYAVAREPCHLHTLDRAGMAAMQVCSPNEPLSIGRV